MAVGNGLLVVIVGGGFAGVTLAQPSGKLLDGNVIYREGQTSRTLYLIEEGTATVSVSGREGPVTTLHQGEPFGLSAVEQNEAVHSTTAIADSAAEPRRTTLLFGFPVR